LINRTNGWWCVAIDAHPHKPDDPDPEYGKRKTKFKFFQEPLLFHLHPPL
jgi:hypothetical protein